MDSLLAVRSYDLLKGNFPCWLGVSVKSQNLSGERGRESWKREVWETKREQRGWGRGSTVSQEPGPGTLFLLYYYYYYQGCLHSTEHFITLPTTSFSRRLTISWRQLLYKRVVSSALSKLLLLSFSFSLQRVFSIRFGFLSLRRLGVSLWEMVPKGCKSMTLLVMEGGVGRGRRGGVRAWGGGLKEDWCGQELIIIVYSRSQFVRELSVQNLAQQTRPFVLLGNLLSQLLLVQALHVQRLLSFLLLAFSCGLFQLVLRLQVQLQMVQQIPLALLRNQMNVVALLHVAGHFLQTLRTRAFSLQVCESVYLAPYVLNHDVLEVLLSSSGRFVFAADLLSAVQVLVALLPALSVDLFVFVQVLHRRVCVEMLRFVERALHQVPAQKIPAGRLCAEPGLGLRLIEVGVEESGAEESGVGVSGTGLAVGEGRMEERGDVGLGVGIVDVESRGPIRTPLKHELQTSTFILRSIIMSILRSEDMTLFQLVMTRETAWPTLNLLGTLAEVHVVPPRERQLLGPFTQQVKRCQAIVDKLLVLRGQVQKENRTVFRVKGSQTGPLFEILYREWEGQARINKLSGPGRLENLEQCVDRHFHFFADLQSKKEALLARNNELRAKLLVYRTGYGLLGEAFLNKNQKRHSLDLNNLGRDSFLPHLNVQYFAFILPQSQVQRLQRLVFRVSRGNALVQMRDCKGMEQSEGFEDKSICFILYQLGEVRALQQKIKQLVQTFATYQYILPCDDDFYKKIGSIQNQLKESTGLQALVNDQISRFVGSLADCKRDLPVSLVQEWIVYALKQRAIFSKLNDFNSNNQFIHGLVWVPSARAEFIRRQVASVASEDVPQSVFQEITAHQHTPPTFFRHNQFIYPSQVIVDTYGVPRYKEANPALFTSITFPFLFGVMFGDISLGLLLFILGLSLIFFSQFFKTTPLAAMHQFRYHLALMGFFAFYCGWIYNDFICLSFNAFGSCYPGVPQFPEGAGEVLQQKQNCVYALGIDPVWSRATNSINFVNSLKMKLSVILGVAHMCLGIFLKGSNAIQFGSCIDFVFEFIPQIIFMLSLFVYMDFLIIFKWLKVWTEETIPYAPSIITTMINIPLKLGHTTEGAGGQPLWGQDYQNTSQNTLQLVLLIIAAVCVPIMLLPKPLILKSRAKSSHNHKPLQSQAEIKPLLEESEKQQEHDQLMVHQVIETIEFCLGAVSNTASYLRLWALSLAHEQLSKVFFEKTIQKSIGSGYGGIFGMLVGYYIYSMITFGVLFCMDTMECFLHALRLHWVQFQNKFFKGDGIKFTPFSFTAQVIEFNAQ